MSWRALAALVCAALSGCAVAPPQPASAPAAVATREDVTLSLYTEPCALPAVKNLPYRAIWRDARGAYEGCYDVRLGAVVVAYFTDRTVIVVPLEVFRAPAPPARGARTVRT